MIFSLSVMFKCIDIWHDVISDSTSEHKSNWCPVNKCHCPLNTPQLTQTRKDSNQPAIVEAIVYILRQGAPDLSFELQKTGFMIMESKQFDPKAAVERWVHYKFSQFQPDSSIELQNVDQCCQSAYAHFPY